MEAYQTEEQQVEAIKKFWQENGNSIITGIAIGLLGFAGYGYYQDHKLAQEMAISDAYLDNVDQNAANADKFNQAGEQFIKQHADSNYVVLTELAMAKNAVEKKAWDKAAQYLQQAVEKAPTPAIKAIAQLRLARVQIQQKAYDKAIATASNSMPEAYKALAEEIKGDAYILQGKRDQARDAYQAAIDADGLKSNPELQTKIDDLALSL